MKQDGIWCVSINKNHDYKKLKSKTSKRVIPLPTHVSEHFNLDAFLSFVEGREGRLFPEATIYKGNCAHYFGKWFNRWRAKYKLPEFHSLRHLVATELKSSGQPEQYAAAILGHSSGGMTFGRYGKRIEIPVLSEVVKASGNDG